MSLDRVEILWIFILQSQVTVFNRRWLIAGAHVRGQSAQRRTRWSLDLLINRRAGAAGRWTHYVGVVWINAELIWYEADPADGREHFIGFIITNHRLHRNQINPLFPSLLYRDPTQALLLRGRAFTRRRAAQVMFEFIVRSLTFDCGTVWEIVGISCEPVEVLFCMKFPTSSFPPLTPFQEAFWLACEVGASCWIPVVMEILLLLLRQLLHYMHWNEWKIHCHCLQPVLIKPEACSSQTTSQSMLYTSCEAS